jgi:hypothetical protein
MTKDVLKYLQPNAVIPIDMETTTALVNALKERLADPMHEVQRLGQEIEQEPVGMVKDLFTSTAWEKLDVRGSTKVYLDIPPQRTEQNFCSRCGKRTPDLITIHSCTPPKENT